MSEEEKIAKLDNEEEDDGDNGPAVVSPYSFYNEFLSILDCCRCSRHQSFVCVEVPVF